MQSRNKLYHEYVIEARRLVEDIENNKKRVALMALEVCDIRHGGRTPSGRYTLGKFAEDIGINRKTISAWIQLVQIEEVAEVDIPDGKQHQVIERLRQAGKVKEVLKDKTKTKTIVRRVIEEDSEEEFFRKLNDVSSRLNYLTIQYSIRHMDRKRVELARRAIEKAIERLNV